MIPRISLTGSADKFLNIYYAFFALIALVAIYFLGRKTGKTASQLSVAGTPANAKNLTYDKSQYVTYADQLEEAMFPVGTDESAIYKVFGKLKTDDDVKQLTAAFGSRRQQLSIGGTTLAQWLTSELSDSEITQLNNILANNSINLSF